MQLSLTGQHRNPRTLYPDQNWFLAYDEVGGNGVMKLYGTPGTTQFVDLPTATYPYYDAEIRGMLVLGDYLYFVASKHFYRADVNGSVSASMGTLLTSTGKVQMVHNGSQIMIVDGAYGYCMPLSTLVMAQIADVDFPGAVSLTYQDGYGLITVPNTGQFWISGSYDFTSWDATDFATAEAMPDNLIGIISDHREVWLGGADSIEIWTNTGATAFPFERMSSGMIEDGMAAGHSFAKLDNSVYWISNKLIVQRATSYTPVKISSLELEHALAYYNEHYRIDDAFAYTFSAWGQAFYVLTFPSVPATWVHNAATGLWHRWAYGSLGRHQGNCYAHFKGKHLVGGFNDCHIYQLDMDTYADDGEEIQRVWTFPPVANSDPRKIVFHNSLEVLAEVGVGLTSGQGSDPIMLMSYSDDGEKTWSNEKEVSLGAIGKYGTRVKYRRLGKAYERTYRLKVTDPVKCIIHGANANADLGVA